MSPTEEIKIKLKELGVQFDEKDKFLSLKSKLKKAQESQPPTLPPASPAQDSAVPPVVQPPAEPVNPVVAQLRANAEEVVRVSNISRFNRETKKLQETLHLKESNGSVAVVDGNGNLVRVYSDASHGSDYKKMAEGFVEKKNSQLE
jgi:hypothetical protein